MARRMSGVSRHELRAMEILTHRAAPGPLNSPGMAEKRGRFAAEIEAMISRCGFSHILKGKRPIR
jgi:hypothetical protein